MRTGGRVRVVDRVAFLQFGLALVQITHVLRVGQRAGVLDQRRQTTGRRVFQRRLGCDQRVTGQPGHVSAVAWFESDAGLGRCIDCSHHRSSSVRLRVTEHANTDGSSVQAGHGNDVLERMILNARDRTSKWQIVVRVDAFACFPKAKSDVVKCRMKQIHLQSAVRVTCVNIPNVYDGIFTSSEQKTSVGRQTATNQMIKV